MKPTIYVFSSPPILSFSCLPLCTHYIYEIIFQFFFLFVCLCMDPFHKGLIKVHKRLCISCFGHLQQIYVSNYMYNKHDMDFFLREFQFFFIQCDSLGYLYLKAFLTNRETKLYSLLCCCLFKINIFIHSLVFPLYLKEN